MASLFQQRALRGTPDGASSGFTLAKKQAIYDLKKNVDSNNKNTARGYEIAITRLQDYAYSTNEKEALDAQILIKGYEKNLVKLQP